MNRNNSNMDTESDDSERWEDFFGTSTELASSVLDIFDTLTNSLDASLSSINVSSRQNGISKITNSISSNSSLSEEKESGEDDHSTGPAASRSYANFETASQNSGTSDLTDNSASSGNSLSTSTPTTHRNNNSGIGSRPAQIVAGVSSGSNKQRNNIRVLSANVQRIITHSDAEPVDTVDFDALQSQLQSPVLSPVPQHRFTKKHTSVPTGHKVKLSHIPLSKVTGKLTQSGSDLVETFNSSSEYLDALSFAQADKKDKTPKGYKKPNTPAVAVLPAVDDEKTPTNDAVSFNFDSIKLIEMQKLATTSELIQTPAPSCSPQPKEFVTAEPQSPEEVVETVNFALIEQNFGQLTVHDKERKTPSLTSVELIEAINKPLISKPIVRSFSAVSASIGSGSRLLSYARSKSLATKANTLAGTVPVKLPTAEQLEELEEASKMSAESLDRLTDIKSKFSPKESRKISILMLPEIAKLKHRPLSSSSICSTSSSSSSGSDHLNGKLTTSYLASVESLADQSENEMMDPHTGRSVFERACLEIVDSERSYVEDLGQVIRGYLLDWKERACLRYDELGILFSNIEEIYDFNSTLLKQLINSGMDPVKIAKCFIDLRERFDVYTTYCTSYPEAISLLTKLLQATHTNSLLASTQKMLQHTLPLGSYLLKPVQRILKYHLLLDNLRKHCEVKEVFQAYELMREVARNIDQVKRKLEQQSRVKELSGILDGWLGPELTVLGELRQEGLLMEHNKPRMVFLFATMLIITKPKEDNRLQFKTYIHQNNLMLREHLIGEPTSFYVTPYDEPRHQIKLTAKNRDQKRFWAQHIKGVMLEKFDNIPNRAKELVYKLGDEEEHTPDKNTWKWGLHSSSSSTPVYLERRNQHRRSEMRNRSKVKRKTVSNSTSFDSFNEVTAENTKEPTKPAKPLTRINSLDDSMLPALQKLAAAVKHRPKIVGNTVMEAKSAPVDKEKECACKELEAAGSCACILRDYRNSATRSSTKSLFFGEKTLKERSKSVPRINFPADELDDECNQLHGSNPNLEARMSKSRKSVEIKQYNHKTIPKRIATLKKQRQSTKGTSKFYMDLEEMEKETQTVLKITESTDSLLEKRESENKLDDVQSNKLPDVVENNCNLKMEKETPAEKTKRDAQIIVDLLKNNKDFEKLCKKPQKKRSVDGCSIPTSPEPQENNRPPALPPRPPSRSPPPLESDNEALNGINGNKATEEDEPIYESLLRNVHVPYKFSPLLGRSNSSHSYKPREKKPLPPPRPESDYVTLVYSSEGTLQQVGDDIVQRKPNYRQNNVSPPDSEDPHEVQEVQRESAGSSYSSSSTLKRDSQGTVISVDGSSSGNVSQTSNSTNEAIYALPLSKNLMKRLLQSNSSGKLSLENVSMSEASLLPRGHKSIDSISLGLGRYNKPPERRVSDVSEMCRQSILHRQGSEAVGERMAHVDYADPKTLFSVATSEASTLSLQRDSVFSLTSSNDSVCEQKRSIGRSTELSINFEYEDDVEASLEKDFRDSAIYSDDNEKRVDYEMGGSVKRPSSPPPPPPPPRRGSGPQIPPKPISVPPIKSPVRLSRASQGQEGGAVIVCPPNMSQTASRSWVLQQIDNFNK